MITEILKEGHLAARQWLVTHVGHEHFVMAAETI